MRYLAWKGWSGDSAQNASLLSPSGSRSGSCSVIPHVRDATELSMRINGYNECGQPLFWIKIAERVLGNVAGYVNYEVAQVVGAVTPANRWAIHAATSGAVIGPASMCITPGYVR